MTSPAMIRPATEGTNAVEPGISRRTVHFLVPGGMKMAVQKCVSYRMAARLLFVMRLAQTQ